MSSAVTPFIWLLDGVTTGTSVPVQVRDQSKDVAITFNGIGTTSGGTLKIEESDERSYTGTWSQIGSDVSASAFSGDAKQVYHVRVGAGGWFRVRITSAITGGGTVRVSATGM